MKVTRKEGPGKAILKRLADESLHVAQVGFLPGGKAYPETGELVAAVAAKQEYGDPGERIPPRPFMRPTIAENKAEWRELVMDGCKLVAEGKLSVLDVLEGVGLQAEGDVVKKISQIWTPPLSPYTIQKRAERAGLPVDQVSKKPLVDTGTMLAQVTHAVVKR